MKKLFYLNFLFCIFIFFFFNATLHLNAQGPKRPKRCSNSLSDLALIRPNASKNMFMHGKADSLILTNKNLSFLTEGEARGLPSERSSSIGARTNSKGDLSIAATLRGVNESVGFALARVELSAEQAKVTALDPAFIPAKQRSWDTISKRFNYIDPIQARVVNENIGKFFGLQFTASSSAPRKWRVVLETDVSRELSKEGETVTYQAEFETSEIESYITLPLDRFMPVVRGRVREDLPLLTSPDYPATIGLVLKSFAFQVSRDAVTDGRSNLDPITADLTITRGDIGFGLVFGMRYPETREALLRAAELYEDFVTDEANIIRGGANGEPSDLKLPSPQWDHRGMVEQGGRITGVLFRFPAMIRDLVLLLDKMDERSRSFPELAPYRDLRDPAEQTAFLDELLEPNRSEHTVWPGEYTFKGSVDLNYIWGAIIHHKTTRESGYFARLHSVNGHALQFLALQLGADPNKLKALELLRPFPSFEFFWNMIFDSRAGGSTDPATWRTHEAPQLTQEQQEKAD